MIGAWPGGKTGEDFGKTSARLRQTSARLRKTSARLRQDFGKTSARLGQDWGLAWGKTGGKAGARLGKVLFILFTRLRLDFFFNITVFYIFQISKEDVMLSIILRNNFGI
jgi:hypothetical protein